LEGPDYFSKAVVGPEAVVMDGVPRKNGEVRKACKGEINNGGVVLISGKVGVNARGVKEGKGDVFCLKAEEVVDMAVDAD